MLQARQLVRTIVHAKSEPEYERMKQELFDATNHAFKQYFLNNWDSCREKWVTFLRDENVHFANTTNNRLECHNHKLKDVTARSMSILRMYSFSVEAMLLNMITNRLLRNYHHLLQPMIAFLVYLT